MYKTLKGVGGRRTVNIVYLTPFRIAQQNLEGGKMEVSKREFTRNVGKYVKEGEYEVEVSDKVVKIVEKCQTGGVCQTDLSDKVVSRGREAKEILGRDMADWIDRRIAKIDLVLLGYSEEEAWGMIQYGCGCRREACANSCPNCGVRLSKEDVKELVGRH